MSASGSSHVSVSDFNTFSVLDCIYSKVTSTFYILDMMCWKSYLMYDCTAEFRFFWLLQKLAEIPDLFTVSSRNRYKFEILPRYNANPEGIKLIYNTQVNARNNIQPAMIRYNELLRQRQERKTKKPSMDVDINNNNIINETPTINMEEENQYSTPPLDISMMQCVSMSENIQNKICPVSFLPDGILLYNKDANYTPGTTPLILLWKDINTCRYLEEKVTTSQSNGLEVVLELSADLVGKTNDVPPVPLVTIALETASLHKLVPGSLFRLLITSINSELPDEKATSNNSMIGGIVLGPVTTGRTIADSWSRIGFMLSMSNNRGITVQDMLEMSAVSESATVRQTTSDEMHM